MGTEQQQERRDFPWLVRMRRRGQERTQTEVAACAGVSTGALSRYESGDTRVLGDPTLRKVCEVLGIDVPQWLAEPIPGALPVEAETAGRTARYHCPTPFCRMNPWFAVPGWIHFEPRFVESVAAGEVVCQHCGATLHSACVHCGAALGQHGVCPVCGEDYVPRVAQEAARGVLELNAAAARVAAAPAEGVPFWQPLRRSAQAGAAGRAAGVAGEGDARSRRGMP